MEARSCAQQLSRQEGGSGIFNFEKSGEGHGAGAFELGGWGCVPECYISPPATLHAWPVQKADWNVGQTPPPTSLFLYLSLSLFVTNITARRRFGKQRECVTLVLSLCFGSLNHTKKIKTAAGRVWHVVRVAFHQPLSTRSSYPCLQTWQKESRRQLYIWLVGLVMQAYMQLMSILMPSQHFLTRARRMQNLTVLIKYETVP